MKRIISVLLASSLALCGGDKFPHEFFAFSNGVPAGSYEEEAVLLKELGYDGISQIKHGEGGAKLAERVATYRKHGLEVLSIYLAAGLEPLDPALVLPLADGGIIELTVTKKVTPELIASIRKTAETAAEMNIRVALYPHHGFTVATMPQAMELAEEIGHPNLGFVFNLCHFLRSENPRDLEAVLGKAAPRLFLVTTNGADTGGKDWNTLIQPLDQGGFPQGRLLDTLARIGYRGPVALQCFNVKGDRRANLRRSMAAWEALKR